jgi:hypothetical protein
MIELLLGARRGVSHANTDLDAQAFLLRVAQVRAEAGVDRPLAVAYRPQVTPAELGDPRVLVWDIGRRHEPAAGNFDHHQDHGLGATPILLLQALGREPSALDRYVDQADRGYFFKHPQPYPLAETLQGLGVGINLVHKGDEQRSYHYQRLLRWVEEAGVDPYGRFPEALLPHPLRTFQEARRADELVAEREAGGARWFNTRMGPLAYLETDYIGANPALVAIPDQVDLRPLFARLSALEPSGHPWGGQAGIGGSPREEGGSGLSGRRVLAEVQAYLG